jgi:hypothetical protein
MSTNQKITLATGQEATMFVPDLNKGRELAIVDMQVLQRLADLLPKTSTYQIIRQFSDKLGVLRAASNPSIEEYVAMLKDEVAFHESVNLIATYKPEVAETQTEVVEQPVTGIENV